MRKYTSKSQKVEMYSKKYNKTEDEVFRILSEHESLLTLDELKIKYDDPEIGKLPKWLLDDGGYDAIADCIETGIKTKFDYRFSGWTTIEDLTSYMWEFVLKRIHQYQTRGHIVTSVSNRMIWLWREHFGRGSYFDMSLQDYVSRDSDENKTTYADIITKQSSEEDLEYTRMDVLSLKDKAIQELVLATAYLSANITSLEPKYNEMVARLSVSERPFDKEIYAGIKRLEEQQKENLEINKQRMSGEKITKRAKSITIRDIIKAMKYNVEVVTQKKTNKETGEVELVETYKTRSVTEALEEVRDYLRFTGFGGIAETGDDDLVTGTNIITENTSYSMSTSLVDV